MDKKMPFFVFGNCSSKNIKMTPRKIISSKSQRLSKIKRKDVPYKEAQLILCFPEKNETKGKLLIDMINAGRITKSDFKKGLLKGLNILCPK